MDSQPGSAPAPTAEPTSSRRNRLAPRPADFVDTRYAGVSDQHLARTLTAEDRSEEDGPDPRDPSAGPRRPRRRARPMTRR